MIPRCLIQEPDSQLDDIDALLAQFTPHSTDLGRAMDDLRLRWTELISSTTIGVGLTAPGQEHLKEHAEFASAELREAARAADAQLARVALRWRRANPEIAKKQVSPGGERILSIDGDSIGMELIVTVYSSRP